MLRKRARCLQGELRIHDRRALRCQDRCRTEKFLCARRAAQERKMTCDLKLGITHASPSPCNHHRPPDSAGASRKSQKRSPVASRRGNSRAADRYPDRTATIRQEYARAVRAADPMPDFAPNEEQRRRVRYFGNGLNGFRRTKETRRTRQIGRPRQRLSSPGATRCALTAPEYRFRPGTSLNTRSWPEPDAERIDKRRNIDF